MSTNAKTHPKQSQHEVISLARGLRPARIIHLDDEPCVTAATKVMLGFYFKDFVTVECSTGDDAWNEISRQNPDLFITDYRHCGMRIEEMLLRLSPQPARFPILIMSAFLGGCPDAKERLLSQADFSVTLLNKPFLAEELKVEVVKCLNSARPDSGEIPEQHCRPGTDTEMTKPGTCHTHPDCKPLLEAATKDLFRNNAFRVTGLSVGATTREVASHANKLTQLAELGQDPHTQNAAFPMKPPPSLDEIREAIQRLKDPEKRLIDEFFWFWPCELGRTAPDPALEALATGNADTALKIWAANETNPSSGVVATHNIALFWQLRAFDLESDNSSTADAVGGRVHSPARYEADCLQEETVEKYWRNSIKRWKYLAFDDLLWDQVARRVRQTDDPRLTSGFVRRMRAGLPLALAKINAELALAHAQKGRMPLARMHVRLLREGSEAHMEQAAELVLAPARNRLQEQIRRAKDRADKDPHDAINAARDLLGEALHALALFDLFFGEESDSRNELFDDVVRLCNRLSLAHHEAVRDDKTCLEILEAVLPFASSVDLRHQIEKNINTLAKNIEAARIYSDLTPISSAPSLSTTNGIGFRLYGATDADQESGSYLSTYYFVFLFIPIFPICRYRVTSSGDSYRFFGKASLRRLDKAHLAASIGLLAWLLISWIRAESASTSPAVSASTPAYRQASTPASSSSTPTVSFESPNQSARVAYKVPSSVSAELERARQQIEIEKAKALALESRLDDSKQSMDAAKAKAEQVQIDEENLSSVIEALRTSLDTTSKPLVDEFNRIVALYNARLRDVRAHNERANQAVDDYNALVREVRAQARIVNGMVDDYNAKLQQSGR